MSITPTKVSMYLLQCEDLRVRRVYIEFDLTNHRGDAGAMVSDINGI